jgi:hypothetical protein
MNENTYTCYYENNNKYIKNIIFIKYKHDINVIFISIINGNRNIISFNLIFNFIKDYTNLYYYYLISIILTPTNKRLIKYNIDTNLNVFSKEIIYKKGKISVTKYYKKQ